MFAIRLIVLGLLFCTFIVSAALITIGIPTGAAIFFALLIVGIGAMVVERRLGREAPVLGITFLSLGAIAGIVGMVHAVPQVNGWIIGLGTLALEIGGLIGLIKLYRVLNNQAGTQLRRRMAARRSWHYAPDAEVPVPGPHVAPYLKGVPNDARTTTGRDIVYATSNGFNVTVFDRVRPNEKNARVQTVWLVHLPMALPFVSSGFARYLEKPNDPHGMNLANVPLDQLGPAGQMMAAAVAQTSDPATYTSNEQFARALMTPQVRADVARLPGQFVIENAFLCLVDNSEGRTGAKAAQVEHYVDSLTGFASRLPWQAVSGYGRQPS